MEIIELPALFRLMHTEEIPQVHLDNGYVPLEGPQVVVRADEATLEAWREENGLDEIAYPVQPSELVGPHIDIYGDDVARLFPDQSIIRPFADFMKEYRSSK